MNTKAADQLSEIKDLMERSSRFISLSGMSGVSAGIIALLGALFAFLFLDYDQRYFNPEAYFYGEYRIFSDKTILILLADAALVLLLAVSLAVFFSFRKAKKLNQRIWTHSARQLLVNLFIPLAAGGFFCIILLWYGIVYLIAPATLIFYGLALINAGKYTLGEIKWLGISETILGFIACIFVGYGMLFWALGFGILHIVYGLLMYFRYDTPKK